jgi:hypothetical protein
MFNGIGSSGSAHLKGDVEAGNLRIVGRCREGEGFQAERVAEDCPLLKRRWH